MFYPAGQLLPSNYKTPDSSNSSSTTALPVLSYAFEHYVSTLEASYQSLAPYLISYDTSFLARHPLTENQVRRIAFVYLKIRLYRECQPPHDYHLMISRLSSIFDLMSLEFIQFLIRSPLTEVDAKANLLATCYETLKKFDPEMMTSQIQIGVLRLALWKFDHTVNPFRQNLESLIKMMQATLFYFRHLSKEKSLLPILFVLNHLDEDWIFQDILKLTHLYQLLDENSLLNLVENCRPLLKEIANFKTKDAISILSELVAALPSDDTNGHEIERAPIKLLQELQPELIQLAVAFKNFRLRVVLHAISIFSRLSKEERALYLKKIIQLCHHLTSSQSRVALLETLSNWIENGSKKSSLFLLNFALLMQQNYEQFHDIFIVEESLFQVNNDSELAIRLTPEFFKFVNLFLEAIPTPAKLKKVMPLFLTAALTKESLEELTRLLEPILSHASNIEKKSWLHLSTEATESLHAVLPIGLEIVKETRVSLCSFIKGIVDSLNATDSEDLFPENSLEIIQQMLQPETLRLLRQYLAKLKPDEISSLPWNLLWEREAQQLPHILQQLIQLSSDIYSFEYVVRCYPDVSLAQIQRGIHLNLPLQSTLTAHEFSELLRASSALSSEKQIELSKKCVSFFTNFSETDECHKIKTKTIRTLSLFINSPSQGLLNTITPMILNQTALNRRLFLLQIAYKMMPNKAFKIVENLTIISCLTASDSDEWLKALANKFKRGEDPIKLIKLVNLFFSKEIGHTPISTILDSFLAIYRRNSSDKIFSKLKNKSFLPILKAMPANEALIFFKCLSYFRDEDILCSLQRLGPYLKQLYINENWVNFALKTFSSFSQEAWKTIQPQFKKLYKSSRELAPDHDKRIITAATLLGWHIYNMLPKEHQTKPNGETVILLAQDLGLDCRQSLLFSILQNIRPNRLMEAISTTLNLMSSEEHIEFGFYILAFVGQDPSWTLTHTKIYESTFNSLGLDKVSRILAKSIIASVPSHVQLKAFQKLCDLIQLRPSGYIDQLIGLLHLIPKDKCSFLFLEAISDLFVQHDSDCFASGYSSNYTGQARWTIANMIAPFLHLLPPSAYPQILEEFVKLPSLHTQPMEEILRHLMLSPEILNASRSHIKQCYEDLTLPPESLYQVASFILDHSEPLFLTEEDALFDQTVEIYVRCAPEHSRNLKSSYHLYSRQKNRLEKPTAPAFETPSEKYGEHYFRWNLEKLQKNSKPQRYKKSDLPSNVQATTLKMLFANLEKHLASLTLEVRKKIEAQVEQNLLLSIQQLSENMLSSVFFQKLMVEDEESVSNSKLYLYKILQAILDQPDDYNASNAHELTAREEMLLKMSASLLECSIGKKEGLIECYGSLDPKYHCSYKAIEITAPKQCVEDFVKYKIQLVMKEIFMSTKLVQELSGKTKFEQLTHQGLYLKNEFSHLVGLTHQITFDPYSQCILDELLKVTDKKFLSAFFTHFTFHTFKIKIRQPIDINESELFKGVDQYLKAVLGTDYPTENYLEYQHHDDGPSFWRLTDKGAYTLLGAMEYLIQTPVIQQKRKRNEEKQTAAKLQKRQGEDVVLADAR